MVRNRALAAAYAGAHLSLDDERSKLSPLLLRERPSRGDLLRIGLEVGPFDQVYAVKMIRPSSGSTTPPGKVIASL